MGLAALQDQPNCTACETQRQCILFSENVDFVKNCGNGRWPAGLSTTKCQNRKTQRNRLGFDRCYENTGLIGHPLRTVGRVIVVRTGVPITPVAIQLIDGD